MRKKETIAFGKLLSLCLVLFASSATTSAQKQNPQPTPPPDDEVLRVETTLVTLPVTVSDRHGKLIRDLKQKQFRIYENGVEQEIAYFEPPAEPDNSSPSPAQPNFTLALLLDVSDSTALKLEQIQRAALAFVNLLRPGDRVMVISFDKRVHLLTDATTDRDAVHNAVAHTRTGGGTSLYDALLFAIRRLDSTVGRKAIVLLTDGVDTSTGGPTADDAVRAAQASDAVIYPIQYDTFGDFSDTTSRDTYGAGEFGKVAHVTKNGEPASEAYKRATLYLRLLADKTGGHFQYTDSLKNLSRSFEELASKLREQYTLGYYPKNKAADGTPRQIKVEVEGPKVTVRTRKSYVYKPH